MEDSMVEPDLEITFTENSLSATYSSSSFRASEERVLPVKKTWGVFLQKRL